VLVLFAPAGEHELAAVPGMSVGIMSASQGTYDTAQLLLDLTQGARVATSSYAHAQPPPLAITARGAGAIVAGWRRVLARARAAPQILTPGLLASRIAGGAGYAGSSATEDLDALLAAGTSGTIAQASLGAAATLAQRTAALLARHALVVADLPGGALGAGQLRQLSAERTANELLLVVQRVPDRPGGELLWLGAAGLAGGAGRELTSPSTQERGLVSAIDLAPTVLHWLGLASPSEVRGRVIETDGALRVGPLGDLMARLHVIGARRLKALGVLLCVWALLLLVCAPWPAARARAIRAGALGVLYAPIAVLVTAGLEPGAAAEFALIAITCLALGAITDRALPWPRAAIAPALAALIAISADALAHTQLLMRSLLGPDPILGARFYGVGNELKSGLAVLVLAALAGAMYPCVRSRRAVLATALTGVVLAVIEGSERIGAGVGGVVLVSAGFAVAAVMLAPGALTRRRTLVVLISPLAGLVLLAAIDLATAHGNGHFTGSILHARSAGDVRDIIVRRYKAAWDELRNHGMPIATAIALAGAIYGIVRRHRLLAPVAGDPGWLAAAAGGLAAGVVGALAEDSGPVLLVVAAFSLGCVLSYLWARPAQRRSSGHPPASRRSSSPARVA
jgi:hypothetical protein